MRDLVIHGCVVCLFGEQKMVNEQGGKLMLMQRGMVIPQNPPRTQSAAFFLPISNTSLGTILRVLNLTSVPGCALKTAAV